MSAPREPIDRAAAERLALDAIRRRAAPDLDVVILTGTTLERPVGWVFFYTSRRYAETGDLRYALYGNAPALVDRRDGSVHFLPTSRPVEDALADYEAGTGPG